MTLDLNRYRRVVKPICELFVTREPNTDLEELISRVSARETCPIIAVCYYMAELYGMTPVLASKIERLVKFYHITEVRGKLVDGELDK